MSNIATIGGKTQIAQAIVVVQLTEAGFPIDPATGIPSTNGNVNIGGVNSPVQAVALYAVDDTGNNPLPGGASVPADAPIQPPQAFVDNISLFAVKPATGSNYDLSNKGITGFTVGTLGSAPIATSLYLCADLQGAVFSLDLSGNALATIDQILSDLVTLRGEISFTANVNLSGGTSAAPVQDKMTVSGAGTIAVNGDYLPSGSGVINGKRAYEISGVSQCAWTGTQWIFVVGLSTVYLSNDNTQYPWQATFVSVAPGVDPIPAFDSHGNVAKDTLTNSGSTITTN